MIFKREEALDAAFVQKVLFILFIVAISALVFKLMGLWLLVFGAIVVAVVLRAIAEPLSRLTRLPESVAVLLALLSVVLLLVGVSYLFGREIVSQTQELRSQIPMAWENFQSQLENTEIGAFLLEQVDDIWRQASGALSVIPRVAGGIAESLGNLLVVVVAGIFIAINPRSYRDGIVRLFPPKHKERTRDTLNATGHALQQWLVAQCFSMVLVGTLTAIGLSIIGVPSAVALGLITGLAQFVPMVGPIVSTIPGLLLAGVQGWEMMLWTLLVYTGVSQLESNFITPMVQKQVTSISPVVVLFAVLGFGSLFGPLGVLFATPLAVVAHTLVMKLYVGEVLHDHKAVDRAVPDHEDKKK
ncbi:AI-2E family transporter [Asticcacaulis tiandongensis]|uniref:AI-2E family transporter n=1 Tax=Asticcacaulis tiandongensis TaxID=2565365 RepID=UPI0011281DF4|nr:AI-2E family transporter [Asticcacaulis tiandongensis]